MTCKILKILISESDKHSLGSMPKAELYILIENGLGRCNLEWIIYRFSHEGAFAGDTWHAELQDAFEQAFSERDLSEDSWFEWKNLNERMKQNMKKLIQSQLPEVEFSL